MQQFGVEGHWLPVRDGDDRARALYLRHYSAQKNRRTGVLPQTENQRRFVGNGEKMILLTPTNDAVFAWLFGRYRKDGQTGINCTLFRNEGPVLSSMLIQEADALADVRWPGERHYTFVDPAKVRSVNPGYCFKQAGWRQCGVTKRGLIVLERLPSGEG